MPLYRMVELKEGVLVQYLGVYVLRWESGWGPPQVGFVEADEENEQPLRAAIQSAEQTLRNLGTGFLTGDAATIALNEARKLATLLAS